MGKTDDGALDEIEARLR